MEEEDLPSHLSSSAEYKSLRKQVQELGKSPVAIIGDYLHLLWAHAWNQIKMAEGEVFVEPCKLKIVVTLPAIWSPGQVVHHDCRKQTCVLSRGRLLMRIS